MPRRKAKARKVEALGVRPRITRHPHVGGILSDQSAYILTCFRRYNGVFRNQFAKGGVT